ncbi:vWA domain-containing protein [Acuticoccus yangtzensis]|uniref:vWA domain-containing protein n=1 Tax=Acuticoccus yangtzensis TaxID=1443441 RepID=UPI000949546D|nr:vWA domain-containing protein [Acuticoccus yangtzensis]
MIELMGLTLLRPLWLAALPAVALLAFVAARRERRSGWAGLIDSQLRPHLVSLGFVRAAGEDHRVTLLAVAAGIVALALAGPATERETAPALRSLDTVVVAVDLSRSMTEGGTLDTARAVTARLLGSTGRPVALILFAADAYLASAPTDDPRLLETLVSVLGPDTMPDAGSRPDRALVLAADVLPREAELRRDVVLISDGGGLGPQATDAANALREAGAVLSAVYIAPAERPYGAPQPQPDALAALARTGGGTMVRPDEAGALADRLAAASTATLPREIAALMYDDHGRALLFLALVPAAFLFRRPR